MTQTQAHNPLLAELRWVHDMVSSDLATVRVGQSVTVEQRTHPCPYDGFHGGRDRTVTGDADPGDAGARCGAREPAGAEQDRLGRGCGSGHDRSPSPRRQ